MLLMVALETSKANEQLGANDMILRLQHEGYKAERTGWSGWTVRVSVEPEKIADVWAIAESVGAYGYNPTG